MEIWVVDTLLMVSVGAFIRYLRINLLTNYLLYTSFISIMSKFIVHKDSTGNSTEKQCHNSERPIFKGNKPQIIKHGNKPFALPTEFDVAFSLC